MNCYFDEIRRPIRRTAKVPQAMGPAYLAGAFSPQLCDVRLYSELHSGPLEDPQLLAWPDMLVLTGLTTAFDRMLHLTAYARTRNRNVIVAAGGSAIRALPRYSQRFFDYGCLGDIEQMQEVIAEAFGKSYVADQLLPRFDLATWLGRVGYLESSRYCNFHCSFCTLTGEGRSYRNYDLDALRRHILALGKKPLLVFIDNNFYGSDRNYFLARLQLLRELWRAGHFGGWGAAVTGDFFLNDENLTRAREAGCLALFSGVESFDTDWLRKMNKLQNTRLPQLELIRKCLNAGIVFLYGLMLDVTSRRIADLRRELDFVVGTPDITLPSYVCVPIPILGTPFFYDCLAGDLILPRTRVRDLDGTTLALRPLDSFEEVGRFLRDLPTLRGYRWRILRHAAGFVRTYRGVLTHQQTLIALTNAALLCAPKLASAPGCIPRRTPSRTHLSTTESLDRVYTPAFRVASRYSHYFRPTMVTDSVGRLSEDLAEFGVRGKSKSELIADQGKRNEMVMTLF